MADDVKTLREASLVFAGVTNCINWIIGVFAVSVGLGGALYWNIDAKLSKLTDAVASIQTTSAVQAEQLKGINQTLEDIKSALTRRADAPNSGSAATRGQSSGPDGR